MARLPQRSLYLFLILLTLLVFGISNKAVSDLKTDSHAKAVFYVHWYDVGKSALEGLNGVSLVTNGFQDFKEINTVFYDPEKITIEDMVKALKDAGTYRGLAETSLPWKIRFKKDALAGKTKHGFHRCES